MEIILILLVLLLILKMVFGVKRTFRYVIQPEGHSCRYFESNDNAVLISTPNPVAVGDVIVLKPLYLRVKDIWHDDQKTVLFCEKFEVGNNK